MNFNAFYFTVPPEMQLIFPDIVDENTYSPGVCYVIAWPMPDIIISTDNGCTITSYSVTINSTYTTAMLFTLDKINRSCQTICCMTQFKMKNITIREW